MSKMDIDKPDVATFLHKQRASVPETLQNYYAKFADLHDKKLWHQLTLKVEEFVKLPAAGNYLIPLYDNFISEWERKMNPIRLVHISMRVAKQHKDPKKALSFLEGQSLKLKDNKQAQDAYVLAFMEVGHYKLLIGNLEGCKASIDECEKILDSLNGIETSINANFYRVSADYYKAKAAYSQYYHNALLFLSSVNLEDLTNQELIDRAHDLALSALLGDGLYNFGELLMHPILDSLKKTKFEYLRNILFHFNAGEMDEFNKIKKSPEFASQPLLVAAIGFLTQKLCLMTLIEAVFKRSKEARGQISFKEISNECRVGAGEVEHLIMKALSLGLIKGKIDEIDQSVQITWIQPRVLDKLQISSLMKSLSDWSTKVHEHVLSLENEEGAHEVFVKEQ